MKRLALAAALIALLAGCAVDPPAPVDRSAAYYAGIEALTARVEAGQMSELAMANAAAELAREHFPDDYLLHAVRDYKILLADRLERGEIRKEEFKYLWSERYNQFLAARKADEAQFYARQAEQQAQQRANAAALFSSSMQRSINNNFGAPRAHCVTVPVGASLTTRCD